MEDTKDSGEIMVRNELGRFVLGHPKIGGRELGTNNFETDFDAVVDTIAKEKGLPKSEVRQTLLRVAYEQAVRGVFPFFKDIADRYYGRPKEEHSIDSRVEFKIIVEDDRNTSLEAAQEPASHTEGQASV